MNEMIRKITGVGGITNTHYIPVIYYCVCHSAASDQIKTADWVGMSNGEEVSPDDFELYKGMAIAVLFEEGFGVDEEPPIDGFSLSICNNEPKRMLREADGVTLDKLNANTVILFVYDGTDFRMVSGISGAQFDDLIAEVNRIIETFRQSVVYRGGENNNEERTGSESIPVYVNDGQITAMGTTIGASNQPVWMNSGEITPISGPIGDEFKHIYLNNDGVIVTSGATVGTDKQPLKLVSGSLTQVGAPLATKEELDTEAIHALDLDPDTFVLNALDANSNILSSVDLPLETMVVGARYENGNIILSLKNGQDSNPIPVVDLVNGLVKDPDAQGAGSEQVPVYVDNHGSVQEATKVIARASTDPVGSASIPVYVGANGVITATSETLGADTTPLKMVNGALTPIGAALATAAELSAFRGEAEEVINNIDTTLVALGDTVDDHEERIQVLEEIGVSGEIEDLSNEIAALQDKDVELGQDIIDLNSRIDNLPPSDNYYHNAGTYNFAAANSTSGLTASISGTGIGAITLNIPIYWGTATPTMSNAPTGAIYLKLE